MKVRKQAKNTSQELTLKIYKIIPNLPSYIAIKPKIEINFMSILIQISWLVYLCFMHLVVPYFLSSHIGEVRN